MAWLHGWVGLIVGWLIFAMAATGTASVFKGEIGDWMRPEITATASQVDGLSSALATLTRIAPNAPEWYITAPDARSSATIISFEATTAGGSTEYRTLALDPVTGRFEGVRDTLGGEFLYRFHYELQLPYPWGRILASIAGMALLVTLLAGVITHRRIFADFFTFRPGKGKRSWLDAHNALGVLAMPFHLMIAFTGILTLIATSLPWAASARFGSDIARYYAEASAMPDPAPASGRRIGSADTRGMLGDALARFDGGRIGQLSVSSPGDANAVLRIVRNDSDQLAYAAATATYAMTTGRLIAFRAEERPAQRTYNVLYGLHMGRFAPTFAHWLYFLCGLALTATIATGLVLWTQSRSSDDTVVHRAIARLTVGNVAGLPLAIASFFLANRLVPATWVARADVEVQTFFASWALALLVGLCVRPRRGWLLLMGACSVAWAILPMVSALTTDRGLPVSVMQRNWTFVGFDLTAIGLSVLAAAIVLAVARHQPPAPRRRREQ